MPQQNIFIQVFATSTRDGGITHLSSVGVIFAPTGPEDIITRSPYLEQIEIFHPLTGAVVSGGSVHVSGFGLASFEQTLLVEVLDEDGEVVGSQPVTVSSLDKEIRWIPSFHASVCHFNKRKYDQDSGTYLK